MKSPKVIAQIKRIEKSIQKNATLLKQGDLLISEIVKRHASDVEKTTVRALHKASEKVYNKCKSYDKMPFHPLPNACQFQIVQEKAN